MMTLYATSTCRACRPATKYSRAAGYFRSTLYVLVGLAFSDFAHRGGKIRLVCSPHLSPEDIKALDGAYEERDVVGERTLADVRELLADAESRPVTEFLATLVAWAVVLDVRIAYKPNKAGIFHQKIGIFEDAFENRVSFNGSANETFSAWDVESNSESFDVFRSWHGDEPGRVARHSAYFERLWAGNVAGLKVKDFPSVAREELVAARLPQGIDDAAERVRHLVGAPKPPIPDEPETEQPPTTRRTLQPHQSEVLANWRAAGYRGIVPHVTGAGKTVTALQAIRDWCAQGRPALVLVPSELLAKQWAIEVEKDLSDLRPMVGDSRCRQFAIKLGRPARRPDAGHGRARPAYHDSYPSDGVQGPLRFAGSGWPSPAGGGRRSAPAR